MSPPSPADDSPQVEYDPVFLHSRKEAILIFSLWAAGFVWAVPFCYLTGYIEKYDPGTFQTIWGIPSWLFWGIAVPWLIADVFTTWFCFWYMADDDLGAAAEGADDTEEDGNPDTTRPARQQEDDA